jgi:hypothetical protein
MRSDVVKLILCIKHNAESRARHAADQITRCALAPSLTQGSMSQPPRVLIVEDDFEIGSLAKETIEQFSRVGCAVELDGAVVVGHRQASPCRSGGLAEEVAASSNSSAEASGAVAAQRAWPATWRQGGFRPDVFAVARTRFLAVPQFRLRSKNRRLAQFTIKSGARALPASALPIIRSSSESRAIYARVVSESV